MPPLIGAIVAAGFTAAAGSAVPIVGGLTVANVLGALATSAVSFGLQSLLGGKPRKQLRQEQVTLKDADPELLVICGTDRVGGKVFVGHVHLGQVLTVGAVHCAGPISGYRQRLLNDTIISGAGAPLSGFAGVYPWLLNVYYESHLGADDQAVSPSLLSAVPGWTTDHRGRGLAYSVLICTLPPKPEKYLQSVFPDGAPSLRCDVDGIFVTDVRTGERVWSDNPALHIREYLLTEKVDAETGSVWRLVDPALIDDASFAAYADICDEAVPLAGGGTEKRYRLNGRYTRDEEASVVLGRMLATCDAEFVDTPDGLIGIKGGWEEPDLTLTEDMFVGDFGYDLGVEEMDAVNRLNWKFKDPRNDYQIIDGDPWDDLEDQAERGELPGSDVFEMVQSPSQGRRLAKIKMGRLNPEHILRGCTVKLHAMALIGRRVVRVVMPSLALDAVFNIDDWEPSGDISTVRLDLSSIDPAIYAWDPATEEGTPPWHPPLPSEVGMPPEVQGGTLELVRTTISAGLYSVQIRASAIPEEGWTLTGRYRREGAIDPLTGLPYGLEDGWATMSSDGPGFVISQPASDGMRYEVQRRWIGVGQGSWSATQVILVTADQTPPDEPTGLVANDGYGRIALAWTAPNSGNLHETRLYRAAGVIAPFEDADLVRTVALSPNQAFDMFDVPPSPGAYRYWVTAANGSGIEGDPDGPVTASVLSLVLDFAGGGALPLTVTTSRAATGYARELDDDWASFGANTLRRTDCGATIEAARTNNARNGAMAGAVVGTPGTKPTNSFIVGHPTAVTGISASIAGSGTESGIDYVDIHWQGTASASTTIYYAPEAFTVIAGVSGETWTNSVFLKLVAGSMTGLTSPQIWTREMTAAGAGIAGGLTTAAAVPTSAALGSQRFSATRLFNQGTAARVGAYSFVAVIGSGVTIDVTIRIGWPQVEKGADASTPIRTTGSAVTRDADDASLPPPSGVSQVLYTFDDASTETRAVAPGTYAIPTDLARRVIRTAALT